MSRGLVLLYHADDRRKQEIQAICRSCGLQLRQVPEQQYLLPIRDLLAGSGAADPGPRSSASDQTITEEMMLICGLNREELFRFLDEFKKQQVPPVALKAALTQHNQDWTSRMLFEEIRREHAMMHAAKS